MYSNTIFQRKLRLALYGLGAILLFMLCHFPIFAAEPLRIDTILAPPMGFVTDDGQPAGLYYEILNHIAETAGLSYTNQIVPFARALAELERGDADVSLFFRRDQNTKLVPILPVYTQKNIIIGRKGARFESLEDLHGKLVAQMRGTSYDETFARDDAIKKVEIVDFVQGITMLMNERVDAMIAPDIGIFFTAQQSGYARDDFGDPLVVNTREAWIQASADTVDEHTIAALKTAIETLLADGTLQRISAKYAGE